MSSSFSSFPIPIWKVLPLYMILPFTHFTPFCCYIFFQFTPLSLYPLYPFTPVFIIPLLCLPIYMFILFPRFTGLIMFLKKIILNHNVIVQWMLCFKQAWVSYSPGTSFIYCKILRAGHFSGEEEHHRRIGINWSHH